MTVWLEWRGRHAGTMSQKTLSFGIFSRLGWLADQTSSFTTKEKDSKGFVPDCLWGSRCLEVSLFLQCLYNPREITTKAFGSKRTTTEQGPCEVNWLFACKGFWFNTSDWWEIVWTLAFDSTWVHLAGRSNDKTIQMFVIHIKWISQGSCSKRL